MGLTAPHDDVAHINDVLDRLLPNVAEVGADVSRLAKAMRYAVLGGGKRLRPRLVYAAGEAVAADAHLLDRPAAAIEFVHAFSLIHDDLPALDDGSLRRGRPTVHVQYDEATAILAGDALLALAFETISSPSVDAATAMRWVSGLASAMGPLGMVGGQMIDIAGEERRLDLAELERSHQLKSGALIHAAVMMGAVAGHARTPPPPDLRALSDFGWAIGLAFQIQDDVLDATANTQTLGKSKGSDENRGKSTYVTLLGVEGAAAKATERLEFALQRLAPLKERGAALAALAEQMVRRDA